MLGGCDKRCVEVYKTEGTVNSFRSCRRWTTQIYIMLVESMFVPGVGTQIQVRSDVPACIGYVVAVVHLDLICAANA